MKIRSRILSSALSVVIVINFIYACYYLNREEDEARTRLQVTMDETSRLLGTVLAAPLYEGNVAQLESDLDTFFLKTEIIRIELTQNQGNIALLRERPPPEGAGESITQRVGVNRGIDALGEIQITYTTADIEQHLLNSRDELIIISLITLFGLAIVIYLDIRGLTRPIIQLTETARAMSNGKLDQEIHGSGADELVVLGESFLRMRDAICTQMDDLMEKNQQLIGEEKQRQGIEQERDRLISVLEATTDYVSMADTQFNIIYINQGGRRLIGFDDRNLSELRITDVHPDWAYEIITQQGIPTAIRDGVWTGETALLSPEGDEIPVSQVILSHYDAQGTLQYMSTVMRDISDRKRIEQSLRIKDDAIASSLNAIAFADLSGIITYVNRAFLRLWGFENESEVVGRGPEEFTFNPELTKEIMNKVMSGHGWRGEIPARRHGGSTLTVLLSATLIHDAKGKPIQLMAAFIDITERRKIEEQLRASEARLAEAQRIAHVGSWELDLLTNKLRWSDEVFRIFEINPDQCEASYERFLSVIHPDDRDRVNKAFSDSVANHTDYNIIHRLLMPDARVKYVSEVCETRYNKQGEPIYSLGTVQDITELKRSEEQLRQYQEQLEQLVSDRTHQLTASNQELESFAYSVSHDLRTPLRAIDGFSRILLDDHAPSLDNEAREYLNRVRQAAQRMGKLIDDLLELSRVGRSKIEIENVDLSKLAIEVVDQLRDTESNRTVQVTIMPHIQGRGDQRLLRQVLENLLGNAWKYTRRTPNASIEFSAKKHQDEIVYSVRDNGVGFDMAYAGKLFHPFQRLHRAEDFEGTGVGLAIVYRILARHGGEIRVESEPGKGTTFHFTLDDSGKRQVMAEK